MSRKNWSDSLLDELNTIQVTEEMIVSDDVDQELYGRAPTEDIVWEAEGGDFVMLPTVNN